MSPGIQVSFLDAASAGSPWVTRAVFTAVGEGPGLQLRARSRRAEPDGRAADILGLWDADDLLVFSARHGHEVELTVLRTGTGSFTVSDRGGLRRVWVTVTEEAGVWTVRLAQ